MNAEDLLLVITCFSMLNPPTWHKMRLGEGELQEFESTLSILRPFWNPFFDFSQSRVHGAETPTKNNNCWLQLWWAKGSNQRYLGKGIQYFCSFSEKYCIHSIFDFPRSPSRWGRRRPQGEQQQGGQRRHCRACTRDLRGAEGDCPTGTGTMTPSSWFDLSHCASYNTAIAIIQHW